MMTRLLTTITLASLLAVGSAGPVFSHDFAEYDKKNVSLTLMLGVEEGAKASQIATYKMSVRHRGKGRLEDTERVALNTMPASVGKEGQKDGTPTVSYSFQNVGLTLSAETNIVSADRVSIKVRISESILGDIDQVSGQKSVRNRSRTIEAILPVKKVSRVMSSTDARGRTEFIDVLVEILD